MFRIGIDIENIARVARFIEQHTTRLERVWTKSEREFCESSLKYRARRYAAMFAAKEAVMKTLGTGWRTGVEWKEIETSSPDGSVKLHGAAARIAEAERIERITFSFALTRETVVATAMAEMKNETT
ncbi:MAG: holo-ACP synthase [Pyrinomonadaceae bacterium]